MSDKKTDLVPTFLRKNGAIDKTRKDAKHKLAELRKKLEEERPKRIIFASDATGSRAGFWEEARVVQARMLEDAMKFGRLEMKIVAYRDRFADPDDFLEQSDWSSDPKVLKHFMTGISCHGGGGNEGESIDAALEVALKEEPPVHGVILVGDEPVVPSSRTSAYNIATELGKKKIPVFTFQDGEFFNAEKDFRTIAENSGGVYDRFTSNSRVDFGDRLSIATVFTVGGKAAVDKLIQEAASGKQKLSEGATSLAHRLLNPKGGKS